MRCQRLFERDEHFSLVDKPRAECAWVFNGEDTPTEKLRWQQCPPDGAVGATGPGREAALESKFAPGHLAEGIVFHHPDGRHAKIKRKDFPARRR